MSVDPYIPLEDEEQTAVVEWLELQGLKFTSIPNSTYTKSWSQKNKNHRVGLRAGFPDMIVLIPPTRSITGQGFMLMIEMKRLKGSTTSKDQHAWKDAINALDVVPVASYVARGAAEAIDIITKHLATARVEQVF